MSAGVRTLIERLYRERYVGFRNAFAPVLGSRDAAHDVVQEAFVRALRDAAKLRREEAVAAWVWRIAFRLALRERGRRGETELPDDVSIVDPERDPALAAAICSISPKRRLVLFLRYYAHFSYGEIGRTLDIARGTVAVTRAQAHAALLDQLITKEVAPVTTDADGLLAVRLGRNARQPRHQRLERCP